MSPINYKDYPLAWKIEIRPSVLKRADNKCEECGAPNHELIYRPFKGKSDWILTPEGHEADVLALDGFKSVKIILTIAHLDHDKLNHDVKLDRLKALCQRCHLKYDMNNHVNNRKYGRKHKDNNHKLDF